MRSFGNQFGNSLYNKSRTQSNNQQNTQQNNPPQQQYNNPNFQQPQPQPQPQQQAQQPYQHQNDFSALINAELQVIDNGDVLTIAGNGIFDKKEIIKNAGFRWDGQNRVWYMQKRQAA